MAVVCFDYNFTNTNNVIVDPGVSNATTDTTSVNTSTTLAISTIDADANNISQTLQALLSSTNPIPGYIRISPASDTNQNVLYAVASNAIVNNVTWFSIPLSYLFFTKW